MSSSPGAARDPERWASRVVDAQRQARSSLAMSFAFVVAATLAALTNPRTGTWLALHLLLIGGVLGAISGATQLLGVTWSASPAPDDRWVAIQRVILAAGTVALAAGRELEVRALVAVGAAGVAVAVALLARNLLWIRARRTNDRFTPAIDGYLVALAWALVAMVGGSTLALGDLRDWWPRIRAAHLSIALFGLVGMVIASTLPFFIATQARVKMSRRTTPLRMRALTAALSVSVAVSATGLLWDTDALAATGYVAYAAALTAASGLLPTLGTKQFDWAGARLVQLLAGLAWWVAMTVLLALSSLGWGPETEAVILALVLGGYVQILVGSLAYLGPVLRGGGHERLTAGFNVTRSLPSLVAGNVAAAAALAGAAKAAQVAVGLWIVDLAIRTAKLALTTTAE